MIWFTLRVNRLTWRNGWPCFTSPFMVSEPSATDLACLSPSRSDQTPESRYARDSVIRVHAILAIESLYLVNSAFALCSDFLAQLSLDFYLVSHLSAVALREFEKLVGAGS